MRYLTHDELHRLLAVARGHSERNWLMMLTAYWHGMRASEVISLRGDDIRDGEITIRRLKGSLKSVHPLRSHADPLLDERAALERYARGNSGVLFPISRIRLYQIFRAYGAEAGLKQAQCHPHVMKHTIAMHAKPAGIENVQTFLGHKNINNTRRYWTIGDDEAAKAVAAVIGG